MIDEYMYNAEGQMIRHKIFVENKEKVIFDKFSEDNDLMLKLEDAGGSNAIGNTSLCAFL